MANLDLGQVTTTRFFSVYVCSRDKVFDANRSYEDAVLDVLATLP